VFLGGWFDLSVRLVVLLAVVGLGEYADATTRPLRNARGLRRKLHIALRIVLYLVLAFFLIFRIPSWYWKMPLPVVDLVVYALALFGAARGVTAISVCRRGRPQRREAEE